MGGYSSEHGERRRKLAMLGAPFYAYQILLGSDFRLAR